MRFEHDGISLWYGTPDAPAPAGTAESTNGLTVAIGVHPADASNKVELLYRVTHGLERVLDAAGMRTESGGGGQYFRAQLPDLRPGDLVEYAAICRCAGRQVPPN